MQFMYELFRIQAYTVSADWLHPEEIKHLQLLDIRRRTRFLSGHWILKQLIKDFSKSQLSFDQINTVNSTNFLDLEDVGRVYFSLSYSGEGGIVVVGPQPVGVDMENLKARPKLLASVTDKVELKILESYSDDVKTYLAWCSKEAAMKVDQSSFSFNSYKIVKKLFDDDFLITSPNDLLKVKNIISDLLMIAFASHSIYETANYTRSSKRAQ